MFGFLNNPKTTEIIMMAADREKMGLFLAQSMENW
jgi:hypothetical protein